MKFFYKLGWIALWMAISAGVIALDEYVLGNWGRSITLGLILVFMMEYADKKWDEKIKSKLKE